MAKTKEEGKSKVISVEEFKEFVKEFATESDRAAVILGANKIYLTFAFTRFNMFTK